MIKTRIILFLGWVFLASDLYGLPHLSNSELFTVSNGLNNNTVYDLVCGRKGFIWLSTDMGISRYDGFRFRNFPLTRESNSDAYPAFSFTQSVCRMHQDADGLFYLQLQQGGMVCFDDEKEAYLPVSFAQPSLGQNNMNALFVADKHILYFATTTGLYLGEVKRVEQDGKESIQIISNNTPLIKGNISHLCGDNQGNLFFVRNGGKVVHYSMGTRQTRVIGGSESSTAPVSHLYTNGDYLWIFPQKESPICYNFKRRTSRAISDASDEGRISLSDTSVEGIVAIDNTRYYLSTRSGLYCLNFASSNLNEAPYTIEYNGSKRLMDDFIVESKLTRLLWDQTQHTLWIGTSGGGAIRTAFSEENAHGTIMQKINANISGVTEDAKGYVWLSTWQRGIWRSTTNTFSSTTTFVPWTKEVDTSGACQMYKDKNGNLWLGDNHSGIIRIDLQTEESQRYSLASSEGARFSGEARLFYLDSREKLWIVTTQGLLQFDPKTTLSRLVLKYDHNLKEITAITEDKEGEIWLGTSNGLKHFGMQANTPLLVGDYEQQVGLQPSAVSSVYVNSFNQIFASYVGKLIRIEGRDKDKVESVFTLSNGLSSGHIFCMIDDNNGNTWVGSNSGIMTIRNDRTSFYNYAFGKCCTDVCRLHDGRLVWADSRGLVFFDPLVVKNYQIQKQLMLSDLWVNGKSIAVGEEINGQVILTIAPNYQKEFVFSGANDDFGFYFSDRQHNIMERKIAYRLLPNDEWTIISLKDGVHFNGIASGAYTLQVKMVYPDSSEGEVLEVPITVKANWWATIWAFIGYSLLIVGSYMAVRHFWLRKEKRCSSLAIGEDLLSQEQNLVKSKQEQEQKAESNEMRNLIFIRFMQELRAPLSMIVSPLREVLQEKELSKGLSTKMLAAYRNSVGMMNACEQLLNVYAYVPSNGNIQLAPYSILKLVDTFVFSINEFLRVHPIEFQYDKKVKKDFEVWVDKKGLELVIQNMLYNAFIHIQYSGVVALVLQEVIEEEVRYCSIMVVDNGRFLVKTAESLSKERNEILLDVDYSEVELGYAVMEDVMKRHHGTISMENLKTGGTKVQIKWPIDKAAFEHDGTIEFIEPEQQVRAVVMEDALHVKTNAMHDEIDLPEQSESPEKESTTGIERAKKTILIVEDYEDIRLYLKTLFEKEYHILLAINGVEGTSLAKKELPDLILSDVMMPLKDGFEFCKEIKETLETCHIPVVLLTAKVEDDDIIKGLEIGADDYILKPFAPKILKVKVKNLIEGRQNLKRMYTKLFVTPPDDTNAVVAVESKQSEIEDPFISTVVKIVEENIQEPDFNVKRLASDLNMSQPTLYRKVKQCTDFTIIELIRGVRLRKAATLLKKKQHSVQEVAEMVGYNDIPTFRKHFVDTYGTTPSTYAGSVMADKT